MTEPVLDLSLVIPAYNEEGRLPPSLQLVRRDLEQGPRSYEVLVVDDGSRDRTAELVEAAREDWPQLKLIHLPSNGGKGAAVRAGMLAAEGRLRLFSDADLSTPLTELAKLAAALAEGAEVAIGSRALPGSTIELHQPFPRELMGKTYNQFLRRLVLPGIHDSQCGFKLFTARAARVCFGPLRNPGFGFDAEVLVRARLQGMRITEVPVIWRDASGTRVSSLRDGGRMLADLLALRHNLGRQPKGRGPG